MQFPPLTFSDLSMLLIVDAILLLFITELASPRYGLTNLTLNKKKLRTAGFALSLFFLITFVIRIIEIIS
jgi:hypothetical protein